MTKQDIINEVLEDWATQFLRKLESSAASRLRADTGQGLGSFDTQVVRAQVRDGVQVTAAVMAGFNEYLRYFDMSTKNLHRDRDLSPEGMERMRDWVRRNLDKLIGGYRGQTTYKLKPGNVPETRIINNIAWGISKKRTRIKRQQWYVKLKATEQYKLYYRLLDELMPVMMEEMKGKILKASK